MLFVYLFVCKILAYTSIDLIQNPKLYRRFVIDFDVSGSQNGTFESTCQYRQLLSFLLIFNQFL